MAATATSTPDGSYGFSVVMAAAVLLAIIFVTKLTLKLREASNLPPGPWGLPILGIMHTLSTQIHEDFAKMAHQYGSLVSFRLGQQLCVAALSPDTVMEILKNQDANFANRPQSRVGQVLLPHDIAFQDNTPLWRNLRKIFNTSLTGPKRLAASHFVRSQEVLNMIRTIPQGGAPVELNSLFTVFTTNVISRMVLNKRLGCVATNASVENKHEVQDLKEIVEEIFGCLGTPNMGTLIPALKYLDLQGLETRFKKLKTRMDAFVMNIISEHLEQRTQSKTLELMAEEEKDMVDSLLDQMEVTDGSAITLENVKSIIWNAFIGGTKTVIDASVWAMTEIVRNPSVMKKAHEELDNVVGRSRMIQESDISSLKYIQAIIKETLRLHPSIPTLVPHKTQSVCKLFGYTIPANTWVFCNVWAIGRNARIWENPLIFNPERFMKEFGNENIDFQGQNFELLPFGSGRRVCPGMMMGSKMLHLNIANMLHAFDWSLPLEEGKKEDLSKKTTKSSDDSRFQPIFLEAIPTARLSTHLYHVK